MGTGKTSSFDAHLNFLDKKAVDGNIYRKIGFFISSCLLFLVNSVLLFFRFMAGHLFRIKNSDASHRDDSSFLESRELKQVKQFDQKGEFFVDEKDEKRMPAFSFKYQSQNFENKIGKFEEEEQVEEVGTIAISEKEDQPYLNAADIHNYRFLSEDNFSGFVEEPETMTLRVHESFIGFEEENFEGVDTDMRFLSVEDFLSPPMGSTFEEDRNFDDNKILDSVYKQEKTEDFIDYKNMILDEEKSNSFSSETNSMGGREIRLISEDFPGFDFDSDTESSSDGYSVKELIYDSDIVGLLSEKDFDEKEHDSENREISVNSIDKLEQLQHESFFLERSDEDDDDDDDDHDHLHDHNYDHDHLSDEEEVDEDIIAEKLPLLVKEEINSSKTHAENKLTGKTETELELNGGENLLIEIAKSSDASSPAANSLQIEFIEDSSDEELSSVKNGSARLDSFGEVHFVKDLVDSEPKAQAFDKEAGGKNGDDTSNFDLINSAKVSAETEQNSKELNVAKKKIEKSKPFNFDSEELDELWEHQDLIEQLKMELKKVRAVGLPTILEESESPRTIEDLKPFRIDEKFLREDPLDELQKFYKSYRERMRKFDILNYQKMYAMGFLQLKNPLHSLGTQRHSFSTIMSHLSQNIFTFCQKKSEDDPSEKLFKDLQCDLETVYVGQTCLSWEFLRWQYEKSRELPESDPLRRHQYNQVADEFQQFQVLVQRFTENEPFQGPRLPNYVKQRCVLRNLLQVPLMKEDSFKDNVEKKEFDYVVTSEMLEDIMEETIRIFWEFVKAEKHETTILIRVLAESNVEVQDPSDYEFMEEIQSNLQKKEKKLKDLLRTGNCLVKKFKKPQEDRSNQDLFFSQVDLKLVSRVLKMPRITGDQLIWCHKKLSKITFLERKVHREPSFLLFPC
ncbi:hypothetical protein KFK09_020127 [Dendrobium nobile]|uniref:Uncharacterized protein n=1 Tax=Dendrobium nobile TaxID=94219 RepID=A0A8T3AT48_DENNO|nr:hypothetical protein KFK09_020127 [Dendrobium nobile]